jgi:hypothetical protein
VPQTPAVATPPAPTGIVYNGSGDFRASPFIFNHESGAISAWSPAVERNNAVKVVDGAATQAVYKDRPLEQRQLPVRGGLPQRHKIRRIPPIPKKSLAS